MSEAKFQKKVVNFLRRHNAYVINFIGNIYQKDVPDLYVAHRYWTGWIELKFGLGKLSPGQIHALRQLYRREVPYAVWRDNGYGTYQAELFTGEVVDCFESIEDMWLDNTEHNCI